MKDVGHLKPLGKVGKEFNTNDPSGHFLICLKKKELTEYFWFLVPGLNAS
jgi:hypothetical protein